MRLATIHGWLPESMKISEEIKVLGEIVASDGFAHVKTGTYMGHLVVRTLRATDADDFPEIREVNVNDTSSAA